MLKNVIFRNQLPMIFNWKSFPFKILCIIYFSMSAMSEMSGLTCDNGGGDSFLQLTKTEALSARQQVALWLTRTSMSDLSSMPSIKNIVGQSANSQSSNCQTNHHSNSIRQNYYHQHRL